MAKQYTNREEVFKADPENWEYMPDADKPVGQADSANPIYPAGATEITTGSTAGPEGEGPQAARPELGMNPQGSWTPDKAKAMFPGMFQDPSQWLDPAEEAKRREGMPYDPNKKYDENKVYLGINAPAIPGAGGPDDRPPVLKMDRKGFEKTVFDKIGGNPFLIQPYDEVIKADKDLPELFNHVFQGQAVWSDLPKLDKDQRAYWEQIKKQHHERAYKEALGKKQQMEQAYKWMMGQFDYDQKQAAAELSRQDKIKARQERAAGKVPTFREIYNPDGVKTLHVWNQEKNDWEDTGKRTGQYDLDDLMPPNVKFAQSQLNKLRPQIDPKIQAMLMLIPEKDRAKAQEMFAPKPTPDQEKEAAQWEAVVKPWRDKMKGGIAAAAPAKPAEKSTVSKDIALIANAKKQGHPKLTQAIEAFRRKYPDEAAQRELDATLKKIKGSHYVPEAGTAY